MNAMGGLPVATGCKQWPNTETETGMSAILNTKAKVEWGKMAVWRQLYIDLFLAWPRHRLRESSPRRKRKRRENVKQDNNK